MSENNTTKKVTKAQRNTDIMSLLRNEKPKFGTTVEDAIKHLTHENELLARKNKSGGKKSLTPEQKRNEQYKDDMREFFRQNPTRLISSNEMMTEVLMPKYPTVLWNTQKISSLLNAMADKYDKEGNLSDDSGELEKFPGKGKNKTTYRIKPEYLDAGDESADMEEDTAEEVAD